MRKRAPSIEVLKPRPQPAHTRTPVTFPVPPEWHQVPDDVRAAVRDILTSIVRGPRPWQTNLWPRIGPQLRVVPPAAARTGIRKRRPPQRQGRGSQ